MILITQPRVGISYNEIISLHFAARELGWDVLPAPSGWRLDEGYKAVGIPYGSQIFCEVIAQQLNWTLKLNSFDWLANLPIEYTKRKIHFMNLAEASKIDVPKFIKPADDKCFDAKVYQPGEFLPPEILPDTTPVLISEVVNFKAEYRCFVKNRQVVTCSCYLLEEAIADPKNWYDFSASKQNPAEFVNEMLKSITSENSVIDVGLLSSGELAIIESNPIWASGLYGCDPIECLKAMEDSVEYEK